eukprot:898298-Amphidinium_carterae.1
MLMSPRCCTKFVAFVPRALTSGTALTIWSLDGSVASTGGLGTALAYSSVILAEFGFALDAASGGKLSWTCRLTNAFAIRAKSDYGDGKSESGRFTVTWIMLCGLTSLLTVVTGGKSWKLDGWQRPFADFIPLLLHSRCSSPDC